MVEASTGASRIVLCEYRSAFSDQPVVERLECWRLRGGTYNLSVRAVVSPDGDADEAWISTEVADLEALWPELEDWARVRRIAARALSEAQSALAQALRVGTSVPRGGAPAPAGGIEPPAQQPERPARARAPRRRDGL